MGQPEAGDPATRIQEIQTFWFGELAEGFSHPDQRRRWFMADAALDAQITERFGADVELALAGGLDHWPLSANGRLALILLLDQFTRNLFRGQPRAFAGDPRALELARIGVSRGDDQLLPPEPRVFLYLPFEHSESRADQNTSVVLFERLHDAVASDPKAAKVIEDYLHHARAHREIIERFGRFPHRNEGLARPSTDAEVAWLAEDGRRFGQ
ncbi:MAG: DUF924 family protein [Pseudomonadales bacterium]|jgi:uncharacterized protein (DUF924 family)|nr:DUF924 family protein [Pseudomonadales bacterium]